MAYSNTGVLSRGDGSNALRDSSIIANLPRLIPAFSDKP